MASDQVAQWIEPAGRDSMARFCARAEPAASAIAQETLRAAASAVERARTGEAAARVRASARARTAELRRNLELCWEAIADNAGCWAIALASAGFMLGSSNSWPQALLTGSCVYAVVSLRSAQRRDALALQHSLEELRHSLRVTQALLEVEVLDGAEPLEEDVEASGTRRVQRNSRV